MGLVVAEHGRLVLPRPFDTPRVREQIVRAGQTRRGSAFRMRKGGVFARDLVGIVDAGRVQVQIVPKITGGDDLQANGTALLRLLSRLGLPHDAAVRPGATGIGSAPLAEVLIARYAEGMAELLLKGPPRRYQMRSEPSEMLRGRINMPRLAYRRPGMEHRIPIRYAPLQEDNPLSRLIKAVLVRLIAASRSARSRELLERARRTLRDVPDVPLTTHLVRDAAPNRLEAEWEAVVELARLLLQGECPEPVALGRITGFTVLFRLHALFERLVRKALRRRLPDEGLILDPRKSAARLLRTAEGRDILLLKPDLLIRSGQGIALVGDLKWKRIDLAKDGMGMTAPDVYQVSVYMSRLELDRGLLLFPASQPLPEGFRASATTVLPAGGRLTIGEVDIERLISPDAPQRAAAETALAAAVAKISIS